MRVFYAPKTATGPRKRRHAAALTLALALTGSGCDKAVCAEVEGGCLALHVDGTGLYDRLEGVLTSLTGTVLKSGDAASEVTLPVTVQVLPPPAPFSTAQAGALRVNAYRGAVIAATGMVTLSWPEGARIDVKLGVIEVASPAPDDLAQTRTDLGHD